MSLLMQGSMYFLRLVRPITTTSLIGFQGFSRAYKASFLDLTCLRRDMLEELMDDEDEVRDMNLSSRPSREGETASAGERKD